MSYRDLHDFEIRRRTYGRNEFVVSLPHQCDEWEITATEDKAEALADLDHFISAAQEARKKLEAL